MNKYELVVIVDAQKPQDAKETVIKQATETVTKNGGKVINSQVWFEKQKFAYRIQKCLEGTYYLVKFESLGDAIDKVKKALHLNEAIVRFLITRAEAESIKKP